MNNDNFFDFLADIHHTDCELVQNIFEAFQTLHENITEDTIKNNRVIVYHGTSSDPSLFKDGFKNPITHGNLKTGAWYGVGVYCTYKLKDTRSTNYGRNLLKLAVRLGKCIIYDKDLAISKYGDDYKLDTQFNKILGIKDTKILEDAGNYNFDLSYSAEAAFKFRHVTQMYRADTIIFTGSNDGQVLVSYNFDNIVVMGYSKDGGNDWTKTNYKVGNIDKAIGTTDNTRDATTVQSLIHDHNHKFTLDEYNNLPVQNKKAFIKYDINSAIKFFYDNKVSSDKYIEMINKYTQSFNIGFASIKSDSLRLVPKDVLPIMITKCNEGFNLAMEKDPTLIEFVDPSNLFNIFSQSPDMFKQMFAKNSRILEKIPYKDRIPTIEMFRDSFVDYAPILFKYFNTPEDYNKLCTIFNTEYQQMVESNGLSVLSYIPSAYMSEFMKKFKSGFDTSLQNMSNDANELFAGISPNVVNAIINNYPEKMAQICKTDSNIINYSSNKMEFIDKYKQYLAVGFTQNTDGLANLSGDELVSTISMFKNSIEKAINNGNGINGLLKAFNKSSDKHKILDSLTEKSVQYVIMAMPNIINTVSEKELIPFVMKYKNAYIGNLKNYDRINILPQKVIYELTKQMSDVFANDIATNVHKDKLSLPYDMQVEFILKFANAFAKNIQNLYPYLPLLPVPDLVEVVETLRQPLLNAISNTKGKNPLASLSPSAKKAIKDLIPV